MRKKIILPKRLPGFRDFFCKEVILREYVIGVFKMIFEKYGYEPLETPALEYKEIFSGETGEEAEKLFFSFQDKGGRKVMLKYELMISMCRAVAENFNKLVFPYKRYQIQPVWRAEKPQKGRFREFIQCDADTIGTDSLIADAEFIQMGVEAFQELGFKDFRCNISNRKFLWGLIEFCGAKKKEFIPICLSIDKLPKIGTEGVEKELREKRKISSQVSKKIISLIQKSGSNEELLCFFQNKLKNYSRALQGLEELKFIFTYLKNCSIDTKYYCFAPYIARGLAYYTGPIWEFEIINEEFGSVAGCGRYDNTIGRFLGKRVPATGGSFGIERIVEIIKKRGSIKIPEVKTKVLVTIFSPALYLKSLQIANKLRNAGVNTILYPNINEKLDKQLKYADKKNICYVVIIGFDEQKANKYILKDMIKGEQKQLREEELINVVTGSK